MNSNSITNSINLLTQAIKSGYRITSDVPATAGANGLAGTIAWDTSYLYVCVATNTWKRVAISTW